MDQSIGHLAHLTLSQLFILLLQVFPFLPYPVQHISPTSVIVLGPVEILHRMTCPLSLEVLPLFRQRLPTGLDILAFIRTRSSPLFGIEVSEVGPILVGSNFFYFAF